MLLRQLPYAIKNQLVAKIPPLGYFLLLAGSLCHQDSWLPSTERSYYRLPMRMLDISRLDSGEVEHQGGHPVSCGVTLRPHRLHGLRDVVVVLVHE